MTDDARPDDLATFVARWAESQAAERANYQTFLAELADALGVERPQPTTGDPARDGYVFDRAVAMRDTGRSTTGYADLYRRGAFVLETKQGADATATGTKKAGHGTRGTPAWDRALTAAKGQAQRYAQNLGADEPVPPLLVVVDVGYCVDLYADFSGAGRTYTPFPDARSFRVLLSDLVGDSRRATDLRERLRLVWTDPQALDPTRRQARVTRALATQLAQFAARLEATVPAERRSEIPRFVTRCLFCLFAEDAGLIPERGFSSLLASYRHALDVLPDGLAAFFRTMDTGGFSPDLRATVRRFNGALFADATALPVPLDALDVLLEASGADWREVEPAIFGTLLERALNPAERHKLGAHFTPRAYVERLVGPAVIEPLRREWEAVQAAVALIETGAENRAATTTRGDQRATANARERALAELRAFHARLTSLRVLDPACGSGNFLYVTLDHLKRLEAEVRVAMERYGAAGLEMETAAVTPANLLGLEVNPHAAALADLVLWIGYLQWHLRTYGSAQALAEPILRAYGNVRTADAVLASDPPTPRLGADGEPVTRWDGRTTRTHPATGREVPDETARVPLLDYPNARAADDWPAADFIIGNPPFIGMKRMRDALGDGYTEALRKAYRDVPDSADFVMFWWERAAEAVRAGRAQSFGFITTNSLTQNFNRRVMERHLSAEPPLALAYAVPDHPWVDAADGAAVRVAFTVGVRGPADGTLARVVDERTLDEDDAHIVVLDETRGRINADLSVGVDLTQASALLANENVSFLGVKFYGKGFVLTADDVAGFREETQARLVKRYVGGQDLTQRPRGLYALDADGHTVEDLVSLYPDAYQRLLLYVKPDRDHNPREQKRRLWWLFGENQPAMRRATQGLTRYIVTTETAKHRFFQFLPGDWIAEGTVVVIALDDAYALGVLSSRVHVAWALAQGGTLEDRPRYNKTRCFDTFPFPDATDAQAAAIRDLAESIDAHRKARQAEHPALTLTDLYNAVEALRAGRALTAKERAAHDAGLASVLLDLHERLDAAVCAAYGWPADLPTSDVLARLAALNAERRAEEDAGHVRYLRPSFQTPGTAQTGLALTTPAGRAVTGPSAVAARPWPSALRDRAEAVREAVAGGASTLDAVASRFTGARRADVADVLDALAALGHLHADDGTFVV